MNCRDSAGPGSQSLQEAGVHRPLELYLPAAMATDQRSKDAVTDRQRHLVEYAWRWTTVLALDVRDFDIISPVADVQCKSKRKHVGERVVVGAEDAVSLNRCRASTGRYKILSSNHQPAFLLALLGFQRLTVKNRERHFPTHFRNE